MSDPSANGVHVDPFEDIYQNAPCGYLIVAPNGRIAMANRTAAAWLAYEPEGLIGRGLFDVLTLGGRVYWETHLRPLLKIQNRIDGVALDFLTSAGDTLPAFATAAEVGSSEGGQTRLAFFKAAERRQFEQSLLSARLAAMEAEGQAQESLRRERETAELREQFIAVLGHDLRNPLAGFVGGVRLLTRENLSDRGAKVMPLLLGSAARMSELIDNILDFAKARLGSGISLSRNSEVSLNAILTQVAEELKVAHPDRAIETVITVPKPVSCDPGRIAQLVSNLLANAIAHGALDQPIKLIATQSSDAVEISIVNGGNEIPPDVLPKLFHPFFRGEVRSNQQGLGLGLHIASEVAKSHGGTLEVTSNKIETCFKFRMPLAELP